MTDEPDTPAAARPALAAVPTRAERRLWVSAAILQGVVLATGVLFVARYLAASVDLPATVAWVLAAAVLVRHIHVAWLVWRVLRPPVAPDFPDVAAAGVRALAEIGDPDEIAQRTLPLLWDRTRWIIRRVEYVAFLDRTMVRRRVSVDFRVPAHLLEIRFDASGALGDEELELLAAGASRDDDDEDADAHPPRYLPVSVLRGWPPLLNLDLRDGDGRPLPLLSKTTTNALDGRLLLALAQHAFGPFAEDIEPSLLTLVHDDGGVAQRAFIVASSAIDRIMETVPNVDPERANRVIDVAQVLVRNTFLWVPVDADEGTRMIVKLAYDEPVRRRLLGPRALLTGFGLRSHVIAFEVGQVGDAGSYHLEVDLPQPLEVTGAMLSIGSTTERAGWRQRLASWRKRRQLEAEAELAAALERNPPEPILLDRSNLAQILTRRVHFYASGQWSQPALATVCVAPERRGVPLAGAVTGAVVAASIAALTALSHDLFARGTKAGVIGAAVGFLLLAPPLVSYVLTRPGDHPFATRMLSGIRVLTVAGVLLAVASAGLLIDALARQSEQRLADVLPWLRDASLAVAALLLLGLLLPPRRRARRAD